MDLSLIIPIHNEEANLRELFNAVLTAMNPIKMKWEMVFVDDGSTDRSLELLNEFAHEKPRHIKIIELKRNYGQTAALAAGIDNASGEIITLLDGDLQNDPADIPLLLDKLNEGYDVVSGWRKDRKDNYLTRILPSNIANWIISSVTGLKLHDYGCTLKSYRREFLGAFRLYGEMHRFIPAYAKSVGAKVTEVVVRHRPRKHGKSNYGIDRTLKVLLDLITVKFLMSYSAKPMRLFGGVGIGLMTFSAAILIFLAIRRILNLTPVLGSPLFQISIVILVLGFQSILMGLIAELLVRTYYESQGKSTYSIRSIVKNKED